MPQRPWAQQCRSVARPVHWADALGHLCCPSPDITGWPVPRRDVHTLQAQVHAQEHAAPDPPVGGPLECCTSRAMAAALQAIPASADKRPALLVLNISFLPKHIRDGKADRQEAHIHIQLSLNCGGGRKLQRHDLSVRLRKPHRSAHLPKFSCERFSSSLLVGSLYWKTLESTTK